MLTWEQFARLPEDELARQDIAEVNLACAAGLPGAEGMDPPLCLRTIDGMGAVIDQYTNPCRFHQNPGRWENSFGIFRIHAMISILQKRFGVRYNPAKIPVDSPLETPDQFIFGIIQGEGGTCGSLPVLYVAVGRRLGYPLKLVSAAGEKASHYFVRWDEPDGERFNIEVSFDGFGCPPDDHYRTGIYRTKPEWEATGTILKSKTPWEELAGFLAQRAAVWLDAGHYRRAAESSAWAHALFPRNCFCSASVGSGRTLRSG